MALGPTSGDSPARVCMSFTKEMSYCSQLLTEHRPCSFAVDPGHDHSSAPLKHASPQHNSSACSYMLLAMISV